MVKKNCKNQQAKIKFYLPQRERVKENKIKEKDSKYLLYFDVAQLLNSVVEEGESGRIFLVHEGCKSEKL